MKYNGTLENLKAIVQGCCFTITEVTKNRCSLPLGGKKTFIILGFLCPILTFSGCSADPNKKANELYVKASQYDQDMRTESESYSSALEYGSSAESVEIFRFW